MYVNSVAYGNGKFVAACAGGGIVYSADGVNWTTQTVGSADWHGATAGAP